LSVAKKMLSKIAAKRSSESFDVFDFGGFEVFKFGTLKFSVSAVIRGSSLQTASSGEASTTMSSSTKSSSRPSSGNLFSSVFFFFAMNFLTRHPLSSARISSSVAASIEDTSPRLALVQIADVIQCQLRILNNLLGLLFRFDVFVALDLRDDVVIDQSFRLDVNFGEGFALKKRNEVHLREFQERKKRHEHWLD